MPKGGDCMAVVVDGKRVPLSVAGMERFKLENGDDAGKKIADAVRDAVEQGE